MKKILVYGYGNPGRQDDALGVLCAKRIKQWAEEHFPGAVDVDMNYQLNIEDAEKISHYDQVIFADASQENILQYNLTLLKPSSTQLELGKPPRASCFIFRVINGACRKGLPKKQPKTLTKVLRLSQHL